MSNLEGGVNKRKGRKEGKKRKEEEKLVLEGGTYCRGCRKKEQRLHVKGAGRKTTCQDCHD